MLATDAHLDELWVALHQGKPRSRAADNAARTDVIYKTLATIERVIGRRLCLRIELDFIITTGIDSYACDMSFISGGLILLDSYIFKSISYLESRPCLEQTAIL